ncbi:DMT family transporter [Paracraurococcus ruber]|uniref:EamA family transporter n=2 Tax=Paracraurococcus ruber TaxID=77675 RepID=A0ABS1CW48_9PROT|nr:DMT family transporter [Paracraurococcus ruber]MBK1658737.1 EamA family transporter [Paracraurococcus ruber]TDG30333.1 DMT family transporter [Paracraurococcus ruber]
MRGLTFVALGYAVISVADATVKYVLPEVGPAAAMVWRGIFGALAVLLLSRGRALAAVNKPLLAVRGLLQACVSAAWYLAWSLGVTLADSYAVAAAAPLLMTLFAIPLLGETVGWRRWCSTAVGFAGVLFMLQPGGELWRWESALLLVATAVMAMSRIWTRMLTRTDTPDSMAFYVLLAQVPVGLVLLAWPAMWPAGGPPPLLPPIWAVATLIGFAGLNAVAQILFGRGFGLAPVSAIAPFEYTPLLWGILLGYLIWGDVPAWTTLGGAVVVVGAGLYNVHRERLRRAEERAAAPD